LLVTSRKWFLGTLLPSGCAYFSAKLSSSTDSRINLLYILENEKSPDPSIKNSHLLVIYNFWHQSKWIKIDSSDSNEGRHKFRKFFWCFDLILPLLRRLQLKLKHDIKVQFRDHNGKRSQKAKWKG
jgi:hypothetical protein